MIELVIFSWALAGAIIVYILISKAITYFKNNE